MHYPRPLTVCVSSQAGCAMGCGFCATGQAGFDRHLTTGEIVEQVMRARRAPRHDEPARVERRVHGHGRAAGQLRPRRGPRSSACTTTSGSSARHLTLSTVGIVPGIRRLAGEDLPGQPRRVAARGQRRAARRARADQPPLPARRSWPRRASGYLTAQGPAAVVRVGAHRRRQRPATRRRELARLRPARCEAHVNLIPLNPTPGYADAWHAARAGRGLPRRGSARSASTPPSARTAAPTSTPPAVSSGPHSKKRLCRSLTYKRPLL